MARRDFRRTVMLPMRVWDAPTRLFHWALVLLIALSYTTSQLRWMQVHVLSGYTILALLLFRLAWGFVGSETARFGNFLGSPLAALRHLRHFRERTPDTQVGHNAAGGWMVLITLLVVAAQVASGLLSAEHRHRGSVGDLVAGPLVKYVSEQSAQLAWQIHTNITWMLLVAAIGLHILAILAYAFVKRHDLVRPMLTGLKRLPATTRQPRMASPLLALALAVMAGALVWAFVTALA
jgi:cytochrome b